MQMVENIVMMPMEKIRPYEHNPRKNDKTVDLLVRVIPKVGFNVPLVIDKEGVIVKGHARYLAAQRLGMAEIPCVVSEAGPEEIKADRIADNKVHEFSRWLNEELSHEIDMLDSELDLSEFGLAVMKMDDPEFDFVPDEGDETEESDEERRARFEQFLAQQKEKEGEPPVQITTQREIDHAKQAQKEEPDQTAYLSVICEKCGHKFFVKEGDAMEWE